MIKRRLIAGVGVCLALVVGSVQADDLMQVYDQAVHNDPTFKQAQSTWWSSKQAMPIAISAYLPQVTLTDTYERLYSKNRPASTSDGYNTQNALTVTATQAIFDFSIWTNIAEQSANVKSATATYLAAIQTLMATTARAYFDVLAAYDRLRFTIANKRAVNRQLVTAEQKFKVGLIAITGVYDAQARYDVASADEITDRNTLYDQLENLRAITGQHYQSLMGIKLQVPLVTPAPDDINAWVATALRQNYTLLADNFSAIAAHRAILNIELGNGTSNGAGGYMPTLDATASWSRTNNFHYTNYTPGVSNSWTNAADVGLSLDWDPFSGGSTYYSTKQARYNYLTALGVLEEQHRSVINQTRKSFVGIKSNISRIRADRQSIISARNALKATEAGYTVGTRTMVDVLNDLTSVYRNENQYMDDQYVYINNIISLKQQAGTLSVQDLEQLNSWLKKKIVFPLPRSYYGSNNAPDDAPIMNKLKVLTKESPMTLYRFSQQETTQQQLTRRDLSQQRQFARHERYQRRSPAIAHPQQTYFAKRHATEPMVAHKTELTPLQRSLAFHHQKILKNASAHKSSVVKMAKVVTPKPSIPSKSPASSKHAQPSIHALAQPADSETIEGSYVVQLFAGDTKSSAEHYIQHSKIGKNLRIVKRDNLYKVLYGHFKDRFDALVALDELPIDHSKVSAWVFKYVEPKQLPQPVKKSL